MCVVEEVISHSDSFTLSWVFDPALPLFADHFPGNPIVPAFHQLARITEAASLWLGIEPARIRMRGVKFLRPIEPGVLVDLLFSSRSSLIGGAFSLTSGGEIATQGEFVLV